MAIRRDELRTTDRDAAVVAFPVARARARARRHARIAMMRRRFAAASLIVVVVMGLLLIGGVGNSSPRSVDGAPASVKVRQGVTLWDLAERFAPADVDPRAYVDALIELNRLDGAPSVGTRVQLPR